MGDIQICRRHKNRRSTQVWDIYEILGDIENNRRLTQVWEIDTSIGDKKL
jgi:hypothetical protein